MKFLHLFFAALWITAIIPTKMQAQPTNGEVVFTPKKLYFSNDFDGALISTAFHSGAFPLNFTQSTTVNTVRFTYFWNFGFNFNYDFNKNIGIFTGVGLKNLGFIEKVKPLDSTIKRRVYALGVPVGIKVGNLSKKTYGFLGGGVDLPFNYREKGFVKRGDKDKFNEWFSDRTAAFMPYAFAGVSLKPGIFFKVQYYPGNFMNPDYSQTITSNTGIPAVVKPYTLYDIKLMVFSIGFSIRYSNKMKIKQKQHPESLM